MKPVKIGKVVFESITAAAVALDITENYMGMIVRRCTTEGTKYKGFKIRYATLKEYKAYCKKKRESEPKQDGKRAALLWNPVKHRLGVYY